jgi:hypothetical protein
MNCWATVEWDPVGEECVGVGPMSCPGVYVPAVCASDVSAGFYCINLDLSGETPPAVA